MVTAAVEVVTAAVKVEKPGGSRPARSEGRYTAERDMGAFAELVRKPRLDCKRVVALDLGTDCGLAYLDFLPDAPLRNLRLYVDLLSLKVGQYDSTAIRSILLKSYLDVLEPDLIGFEEVRYTPSQEAVGHMTMAWVMARVATASEMFGVLKNAITEWSELRGIPCRGFSIQTIKQAATGKGNANKSQVVAACNAAFGFNFDPETCEETHADDMADAAWVLYLTMENFAKGL